MCHVHVIARAEAQCIVTLHSREVEVVFDLPLGVVLLQQRD